LLLEASYGKKHDIYANPNNGRQAPIPRQEIKASLCELIRKQLGLEVVVKPSLKG
jgi:hypothetical protein